MTAPALTQAQACAQAVAAAMGDLAADLTVTMLHPELEALGVPDFRRYRLAYVVDTEPLFDLPIPTTGGPVDYGLPYGCRCYIREDADDGDIITQPADGCPRHRYGQLLANLAQLLDIPPGLVTP